MIIRKTFKWESAHRVRSSTCGRCRDTLHGHSYITEVYLSPVNPDSNDDMVMDFGDLKKVIGNFMDSLDHTTFIWLEDDPEYTDTIFKYSKRVVAMVKDPTAENIARATLSNLVHLLKASPVEVVKVRVHETATGYAEAESFELADRMVVCHDNAD